MSKDQHQWHVLTSEFLAQAKKPLIVVLGPTASGKTALSIDIARSIGTAEIINADSRQFYRHLDIGTAKITKEEMQDIPHHLFSVLDPKEEVTIAWYQKEAMSLIDQLHAQKKVPMLVGGSMLYISAIVDGLQPIDSDPAIRQRLEEEYDRDQGRTSHKRLQEIDSESAASIPVQNRVYVIRALEIFEMTGMPKSTQKKQSACPYDVLIIGVDRPREELNERIDQRVGAMFAAGWVEEVRSLMDRGYIISDPGIKSTGYSEIMLALQDGRDPVALKADIAAKTRQYAKRQRTWWKGDERIVWISA